MAAAAGSAPGDTIARLSSDPSRLAVVSGQRRPARGALLVGFATGVVVVLILGGIAWLGSGARFDLAGLWAAPGVALSAQERQGQEIYNANCVSCHGGPTGGGMMDYPPRHNANGHTWHHPDCELKQVVRDGGDEMTEMMRRMMAPPDAPKMQPFKDRLSDQEIDAVLAFIRTMWTPDERDAQAQITRESCPVVRG